MPRPQQSFLAPRPLAAALLVALWSGVLAGGASAQISGRIEGTVRDLKSRALAGASVRMVPDTPGGEAPGEVFETEADENGRWAVLGPGEGRWRLTIEADGFIVSRGWIQVSPSGRAEPVDVRLRSLDEVSPAFSEGGGSTVLLWIEQGDSLLQQGNPGAARREYEKALRVLPPSEHPEVLQTIARTHFLEGDLGRAVESLESALRLATEDEDLRALYVALLAEMGQPERGESFLEQLKNSPPGAPAGDRQQPQNPTLPPDVEKWSSTPAQPALPGTVGRQRVSFSERSPWSRLEVFTDRSGWPRAEVAKHDPTAGDYAISAESFQLFVPERAPEAGYGLLVWIAPTSFGAFGRPEMEKVLSEHGIIWVGADNAGNPRPLWDRWGLALDAVENLSRLYPIDPDRVYVSGYSGGGRVSTALATLYPEVFRGGFSWFGADHFHPLPVLDRPGASWPPGFPEPPGSHLRKVREETRFVLLTGERDFNRSQTISVFEHLEADGFDHVTFIEIPQADHYFGIRPPWMGRGIEALDAGRKGGSGTADQLPE